ncbi:LPS export ABC transporter periplasmic protein LptC [Asticcacaulis sp. EMRT-3]|uniref:LPS export ABC transporter periplasmic protein LptC n=1 Tax=Asticcacaulis sp. EMRT-3 TaxID=3040349 RepID=UPI0024AF590C|nr:LPS export ABC transporter periplasmic protein LptC [Asticcacaulis sp. EMRT-3]MDI7775875.1 LPS export ABC transporter periplasmic protein LptC [Asticcacaulis sp. EMRT-3]
MNLSDLSLPPTGHLPGAQRLDAETETALRHARLAKQAIMVRRRSRRIKSLRYLFPGAVIALLLLNIGWITVQTIINSMNIYGSNDAEIRMTNPRYFGRNDNGEHYTIGGLEAVRKGPNSVTVTLKAPNIDFRSDSGSTTHVTAANGVYDQTTRRLTLMGHVVMVSSSDNMNLKTDEAVVDMINSTISGDKHVEGTSTSGHIVAESFALSDDGKQSIFHGRGDTKVWITINQTK